MRILMYATYFPPHYSGAAKQALALAKRLRHLGHHIEFITLLRDKEKTKTEYEGFKVWRIKDGRGRCREFVFWFNFFKFLLLKKNEFDILHSHGAYYYNSIIGPLGLLFKKKSIVKASMAKNDLAGMGQKRTGKLHLNFLKLVDVYIAISKDLENEFKRYGFLSNKIFLLPNGVDTERFKPLNSREKIKKKMKLNLSDKKLIALTVGVFDQRKNIGWLISEWVKNKGFGTDAVLVAVGPESREDKNGTFLKALKDVADSNPDLVKIVGHVSNIEDFFQTADFFILPSTNEGMPNVVLEAMSSGLPCITTKVSGCMDLVKDGKNGFTFNANNPESFHQAMIAILTCNKFALSLTARDFVLRNYSLDALAKRYETLYHNMLSSRRN